MADIAVNTDILNSQHAKEYYARADRRIMVGLRVALEMLGIPVPEYARRKPVGRPPSKALATAFNADQGNLGTSRPVPVDVAHDPLGEHRLGAAIAKAHARAAKRKADLFTDTFNG
jgi:hypothetical protein